VIQRSSVHRAVIGAAVVMCAFAVSPAAQARVANPRASAESNAMMARQAALRILRQTHAGERLSARTPNTVHSPSTSPTWSGYADINKFNAVNGAWQQPTITCHSQATQLALFWVGFDGINPDPDLEQVGTVAECYLGSAYYYGFWMMQPATTSLQLVTTISPGDEVAAALTYIPSTGEYRLKLTDSTNAAGSFVTRQVCSATCARTSADWIVSTPTGSQGAYPLAHFSRWKLSAGHASSPTERGTIALYPGYEIAMYNSADSTQLAAPYALNPGGTLFKVAWLAYS
jgi:Peptidase A4 family